MDALESRMLQAIHDALDAVVPEPYRTTMKQHLSTACTWELPDDESIWCETHDLQLIPGVYEMAEKIDGNLAKEIAKRLTQQQREFEKEWREQSRS